MLHTKCSIYGSIKMVELQFFNDRTNWELKKIIGDFGLYSLIN